SCSSLDPPDPLRILTPMVRSLDQLLSWLLSAAMCAAAASSAGCDDGARTVTSLQMPAGAIESVDPPLTTPRTMEAEAVEPRAPVAPTTISPPDYDLTEEFPVHELPLVGPIAEPATEVSGLAWHG